MKNISFAVEDFTYDLPENRIALHPAEPRDSSKLLIFENEKIKQDVFRNIENYIGSNCNLIFNNSKVIQARLEFFNENGARIEVFCLEPLNSENNFLWKCFVGNAKKLKNELQKLILLKEMIITLP
jgi:S-adenosylmethionine:tRNA ribosyltransferase-isomerase